jgi:hypothetical protein
VLRLDGRRPLGRLRHRRKYNIKMYLGRGIGAWTGLLRIGTEGGLYKCVDEPPIFHNSGNFLTVNFVGRTLLHGFSCYYCIIIIIYCDLCAGHLRLHSWNSLCF